MVDSGIYGPNGEWDKMMRRKRMNDSGSGCGGCLVFLLGLAAAITALGWVVDFFAWVGHLFTGG